MPTSLALCLVAAPAFQFGALRTLAPQRAHAVAIDAATLQEVCVYDSMMEERLEALEEKAAAAEAREAQATAKLADAEARATDATALVANKTAEVQLFVETVEGELTDTREKLKLSEEKVKALTADLSERTDEVTMLNTHLEAHTGATIRLNEENAALKAQVASLEAAAAASPEPMATDGD